MHTSGFWWQFHLCSDCFGWSCQSKHMQYWIWEYKHKCDLKYVHFYIHNDLPCATVCCTENPSIIEESAPTEYAGRWRGRGSGEANLPPNLSNVCILASNNFSRVEVPAKCVSPTGASKIEDKYQHKDFIIFQMVTIHRPGPGGRGGDGVVTPSSVWQSFPVHSPSNTTLCTLPNNCRLPSV